MGSQLLSSIHLLQHTALLGLLHGLEVNFFMHLHVLHEHLLPHYCLHHRQSQLQQQDHALSLLLHSPWCLQRFSFMCFSLFSAINYFCPICPITFFILKYVITEALLHLWLAQPWPVVGLFRSCLGALALSLMGGTSSRFSQKSPLQHPPATKIFHCKPKIIPVPGSIQDSRMWFEQHSQVDGLPWPWQGNLN